MGGRWLSSCAILALALSMSACARKDRVAPCAPGEGLISRDASLDPHSWLPFVVAMTGADPCGPLRPLNVILSLVAVEA